MMASDLNKPGEVQSSEDMDARRKRAQRARNIAIALALAAFVLILYVATWAKLGANVMVRPL